MATPRNDYSPWVQRADESLLDYYKRLNATREGGILGTAGLMDVPKSKNIDASKGEGAVALGEEIIRKQEEGTSTPYDPYTGSDWESGGYNRKDQRIGDALDRLTGREYAGQGLLYGIPNLLSNWSDRSEVEAQLKSQGWTDEQISQYMDSQFGLEALKATQSMDRLGVMSKDEYDYKDQNTKDSLWDVGKSVVGSLFGMDKEQSRQSPMRPASEWDMPLVTPQAGMWANIAAAQERKPFDPYASLTQNLADQQKWVDVSAQNVAAEEARKAEAARVAAEQARAAEAVRQAQAAEAARVAASTSSGDGSIYDRAVSAYTTSSSGGSTTGYASSGGTQTVGTGGGNASRGYSYGGW